jgi:hypothetical protein
LRPVRTAGRERAGLACEHVMRLGRDGRWSWSEACFCTDRAKGTDPSNPFAHAVRCDDPRAVAPSGR